MEHIIIVAGGKGMRMGADLPKQFLPLGGKPVLMHTIERFREYSEALNIVVVLPKEQQAYWQKLCDEHGFDIKHTIADGGETRFHSSRNGLLKLQLSEGDVVGIHDGVRPFVSVDVIANAFRTAKEQGACIPTIAVVDTLRYVGSDAQPSSGHNVLRSNYRIVQTPQVFRAEILSEAFRQPYKENFTDDASVVEAIGFTVAMIEGNRENIKLTTPFDLKIATAFHS